MSRSAGSHHVVLEGRSRPEPALRDRDLAFVRTASFDDCRYWLWRFPMLDDEGYALVLADGEEWLSWRTSRKGASPEQVLLDDWKSGH